MAENRIYLALFPDLEPAADAIEQLRSMGIHDEQMNVISGVPVTEAMLGRPRQSSNVPRLALGGAILGFFIGFLLSVITPTAYEIQVGRQGFIPGPPTIVVFFEMTMLFMLLSTFLGVFLDSYFPSYRPMEYVAEVSDGKIAVLYQCESGEQKKIADAMKKLGAESVTPAKAQQL